MIITTLDNIFDAAAGDGFGDGGGYGYAAGTGTGHGWGYGAHAYPVVPTAPHNHSQPCIEVKMSKSSQHHGGQAAPAVTLSVLPKSGRPRTEPPEWQRKKRQHHIGLKNSRRPLAAFQDLAACWLRATGGWTPVLPVKSC